MCYHVVHGGAVVNVDVYCPICGKYAAKHEYVQISARKPFPSHIRWFHKECWLINMKKARVDYDLSKRIVRKNRKTDKRR